MISSLSPDQVRAEIQKFWQIMCGRSTARLVEMYSPSALLLTGKAKNPEPASMALARRARQISGADPDRTVELGPVEVQMEEPGIAIALYTYRFHQIRSGGNGGLQTRHTLYGRATQIFELDQRGVLQIVHEHLSAATGPEVEASDS